MSEIPDHIILRSDITLKCIKHDKIFETKIESFMKSGVNNCNECYGELRSEIQSKSSINDVKKITDEKGYTLLTEHISNVDDEVLYICNEHPDYGIQKTSLYGLRKYEHNCRLCRMPRGENHFNWKGGISSARDHDMSGYEYKKWHRLVFKRDDYTCQCCGKRSGKLNAHHVQNYSSNKKLRYDVSNGITLCEECHLNNHPNGFHKLYGNYNNTKEQLQQFLDIRRSELGLPLVNLDDVLVDFVEYI